MDLSPRPGKGLVDLGDCGERTNGIKRENRSGSKCIIQTGDGAGNVSHPRVYMKQQIKIDVEGFQNTHPAERQRQNRADAI